MLCQHHPSDSALWHTSVKLQHTAQALLIEQFLLNGKKPTQPYRASRPRSVAAVDDANQTVCFLVVLASLGPDLVLTFHVPHGEIRSLVPNVSTLIPVVKIVATNSSSFQLYRIVVSLAASSPTAHIPISVLPTTHYHTCARLSCQSCLEEVSQLLIYQVSLINLYWVRLHGDFRRNKESTMFLASSTKTKNSFVSVFGFFELFLLFLSTAAR